MDTYYRILGSYCLVRIDSVQDEAVGGVVLRDIHSDGVDTARDGHQTLAVGADLEVLGAGDSRLGCWKGCAGFLHVYVVGDAVLLYHVGQSRQFVTRGTCSKRSKVINRQRNIFIRFLRLDNKSSCRVRLVILYLQLFADVTSY